VRTGMTSLASTVPAYALVPAAATFSGSTVSPSVLGATTTVLLPTFHFPVYLTPDVVPAYAGLAPPTVTAVLIVAQGWGYLI